MRVLILTILFFVYNFTFGQGAPCSAATTTCTSGIVTASDSWTAAGGGIVDPGCGTTMTTDGQYWVEFTPTGATFQITADDNWVGGGVDPLDDVAFQLYRTTGACSSTLTYIGCYDNDNGTGTNEIETFTTVAGNTYYIRFYDADGEMDFAGGGQNHDFSYCIYEEGEVMCTALPITSFPYTYTGTTVGASNTFTGGCHGNEPATSGSGEDFFFSITVGANSYYTMGLTGTTAGNYTELTVVETTDCENGPFNCHTNGSWLGGLQADNSPASAVSPVRTVYFSSAGTYYIKVDASFSASGPFTLNVDSYTPTGGDACSNAVTMSAGTPVTINSTNETYTVGTDDPAPGLICAGSLENTNWLLFQSDGSGADVALDITSVSCNLGYWNGSGYGSASGQFGILVSDDGTCSGTFSDAAAVSGSDGFTGCTAVADATTYSTTLDNSIVRNYYFVWDGNLGAECGYDITVTNVNTLPVELIFFDFNCKNNYTHLYWATASERNADFFVIQRSADGIVFEDYSEMEAYGNSTDVITYDFLDTEKNPGFPYFRLKQIDFNGKESFSKIIRVDCLQSWFDVHFISGGENNQVLLNNPDFTNEFQFIIYDVQGKIVKEWAEVLNKGTHYLNLPKLNGGYYLLNCINAKGEYKSVKFIY